MDFRWNVTLSGEYHHPQEQLLPSPPPCSKLDAALTRTSPLDDLFPAHNTEVDVSLEWLSVFVEDCLSSTGNCIPAPTHINVESTNTTPKPPKPVQHKPQRNPPASFHKFVIPGKARSKRKRVTSGKISTTGNNPLTTWFTNNQQALLHFASADPPLLQQTYWLADSELIMPRKEETQHKNSNNKAIKYSSTTDELVQEERRELVGTVASNGEEGKVIVNSGKEILENSSGQVGQQQQQQARRCSHCLAQRTPQWRAGPLGPKTLCNACGVRYKSGRLLPEYRPAKSPTFVSYLHSNSHKKVMEMRMATTTTSSAVFHS